MALTGFWVDGVCAPSQAEAVALLNAKFPVILDAFLHVGSAVASGTNSALLTTWTFNLGVKGDTWITHAMIFNFSACDPVASGVVSQQMFNDGLDMGWGVVGAMFSALAVIFLTKALFK